LKQNVETSSKIVNSQLVWQRTRWRLFNTKKYFLLLFYYFGQKH